MIRFLLLSFCLLFILIETANAKKKKDLEHPKEFFASVQRIIDGDTIVVDVKLWPTLRAEVPVRIRKIDVPERSHRCQEAVNLWNKAKKYLEEKMPQGTRVKLYELKKGSFGTRVVARIHYQAKTKFKKNLVEDMIKKRLACPYEEKPPRRDWCKGGKFNPYRAEKGA